METSDIELIIRILLQIVLLSGSAIFSGSEAALFSLSWIHLQKLRNTRDPASEGIHPLLDEPRRLIISILSAETSWSTSPLRPTCRPSS
jgi:Mg2+/Co2+ transporter CorB